MYINLHKVKTHHKMKQFIISSTLLITALLSPLNQAKEPTKHPFMEQLKKHYQDNSSLERFDITFKAYSPSASQSYDVNHPDLTYRRQKSQFDFSKKQYFSHMTRGNFPGGFLFETKEFQKGQQSVSYDVNGVLYGKQVIERPLNAYAREVSELNDIVDFFAIKELINANLMTDKIEIKVNNMANSVKVKLIDKQQGIVNYEFQQKPIRLKSMHREKENRTLTYSQYIYDSGISYASSIIYKTQRGETNYSIDKLKQTMGISAMTLAIPTGYGPLVKRTKQALMTEKLAKNLYMISHVSRDRHVVYQVNGNKITVFGAPSSDKVSEDVMAHIYKKFPMKKISHVYITHPHNDHIGGLTAYAKKGTTILADTYSVNTIKAYPRFAKDIAIFKFHPFKNKDLINGARFYIPKNSHAKGQSFVHFEQSEIIYEGDLLEIPFDNTIATYMSAVEKEFVEFVHMEKLKIKRIVGHHRNGNISPEVMNSYYQANNVSNDKFSLLIK